MATIGKLRHTLLHIGGVLSIPEPPKAVATCGGREIWIQGYTDFLSQRLSSCAGHEFWKQGWNTAFTETTDNVPLGKVEVHELLIKYRRETMRLSEKYRGAGMLMGPSPGVLRTLRTAVKKGPSTWS